MNLALALALLIFQPWSAAADSKVEVRVRVQREAVNIELTGFGLRISSPSHLIAIAAPSDGHLSKAKITRSKKGVWLVKRAGEETLHIDSERLAVRGQMLRLGMEPVPHELEILPNPKAGMDVVARLDMESYLAGVLPSEMPASWPIEALKAQAVAARSFVLRTAYERRNKHFDVDSTVMDQVYKFLHEAKGHPEWKARITKAINDTRGEVLMDDRNRVVKAFYSADCGCQTEDPKFVWGKVDTMKSVTDPTCGQRKTRQWNVTVDRLEVREKLIRQFSLPEDSNLRAVQIAGRTPSGRVANVMASLEVDGKNKQILMNSQQFRKIFGFDRIRSTDFKLRWLGSKMQILGSGMGHGVGLCQTGAKAMAEGGMDYREILKLYYPKVKLSGGKPDKPASPPRNNAALRFRGPV